MFRYNRFWHFWFELNSWHYYRAFLLSLFLVAAGLYFPPFLGIAIAFPLAILGTLVLFTQLSNLFYKRQNQRLTQIKAETDDETLQKEIDLYLNRRVVSPLELLAGTHLNLPDDTAKIKKAVLNSPLVFAEPGILEIRKSSVQRSRNPGIRVMNESNQLYIKTVAAEDGLSEVAAREMAVILGLGHLIPLNTVTKLDESSLNLSHSISIENEDLAFSRQRINELIEKRRQEVFPESEIKNSPGVQNAVAKFLLNLKTSIYRTKVQKNEQFKLLHTQKLIPNALDGEQLFGLLFNEHPFVLGQLFFGRPNALERKEQRARAKDLIKNISISSFQENFLLHLILGSQDVNPGNILFTDVSKDIVQLHSIDHERIMPEDNYNITKKTTLINGSSLTTAADQYVENVFPIRLWLAGLPQANIPFTKEIIEKMLPSLNPKRMLAYHNQKKLFSPAAVGAQLDRILIIKKLLQEEIKKPQITLTPKALFLKFINNHPTYIFSKSALKLSDFTAFALLGHISEGADRSLLRHPLQWFSMSRMASQCDNNLKKNQPPFSEKNFKSTHAHNLIFFNTAMNVKARDKENKEGIKILENITKQLKLN